jgi:linoleate 10R-lipoxygenase
MMFAFANLIIHSLFKTDDKNVWQNNTSSYLDLSPLYGCSLEEQLTVRNIDGRGLLYPDTFADQRLLMMPPATPALLIMFSRNHK